MLAQDDFVKMHALLVYDDIVKNNTVLLNKLKSQISDSVEAYTKEYENLTKASRDLQNFANEQLSLMNDTIMELSDKITEIQGQV